MESNAAYINNNTIYTLWEYNFAYSCNNTIYISWECNAAYSSNNNIYISWECNAAYSSNNTIYISWECNAAYSSNNTKYICFIIMQLIYTQIVCFSFHYRPRPMSSNCFCFSGLSCLHKTGIDCSALIFKKY